MKGQRKQYSLALFYDLEYQWHSWRAGIMPHAGMGSLDMNPNVVAAFVVLERARAAAMPDPDEE